MEEQGYISRRRIPRRRSSSGLGLNPGHKYQVIRDPFLFDLVQQELIDRYGINTVRNGGLKAYTTIDPELQERAEGSGRLLLGLLPRRRPGRRRSPRSTPTNGEIVALASTRRLRRRKPVQLRLAGAPPARLLVQDLRPDHRDQAGDRPRHDLLRRHLAEDPGDPGRRHLDRQQRRAGRRRRCRSPRRPGTRSTSSSPSSTSTSAPKTSPTPPTRWGSKRRSNRCRRRRSAVCGIGVTPLEMADGLRDPRQRRHPPRPDRDQPGRIPRRQGRRTETPTPAIASSPRARPTK